MNSLVTTELLAIFKTLVTSRLVDEKMSKLVKQNKGGTFQLSAAGHELIGAVCAQKMRPGVDWACPYYRDQAMAIGWGCDLVEQFGVFLGRVTLHHSAGRMMPYHYSHKPLRIPTQSSVVGSQWLPAAGIAHGLKMQGIKEVVYVSGGDGATSEGDFHEALNYAGLHKLPVIFVVHDNGWAISVPVREQTAGGSVAQALQNTSGVAVHAVDGTQYQPLATAVECAIARALGGDGPSVIVAKVPRLSSHSNSDDPGKYRPKEDLEKDMKRDPLPAYKHYLLKEGVCSEEEMKALEEQIHAEVEEAAHIADQLPFPFPESAQEHVFKPWHCPTSCPQLGQKEAEGKIVMVDAINAALVEEMERDAGVVVLGEDVAYGKGGVFGVTRELTAKFGPERCFNTPLAEATIAGVALGLSLDGFHKPVAEIQFADYLWPAFDQLASEIASIHYRSAGQWDVPLVLRMPYGGYIQGGPYHSQSIEAILAHCPGLKIAIPSNAADAKGLLKAAIRDPNPVLFLEHKALYRQTKFCARVEPGSDYLIPFGKANVVREGQDLTLVGWGMMVVMAMDVASKLAQEGIDIEVIDLRTIIPCDIPTIVTSVKKTGKLLIAHEAPRTSGFGGEIAAQVAEAAFEYLDGPITRVCGLDAPVPYSKPLETAVLPQPSDLEKAIRDLVSY
ncbi:MAG: MFS transporter [Verrucomicrobia bacterium]|nr:MFS transporter [Verrucomicrobiota bacterium]